MAMSYVWCFLLLVSIAYSIFAGTAPQTGSAALSGAQSGVTLAISLAGVLCLWSGLSRVMEKAALPQSSLRFFVRCSRASFPTVPATQRRFKILAETLRQTSSDSAAPPRRLAWPPSGGCRRFPAVRTPPTRCAASSSSIPPPFSSSHPRSLPSVPRSARRVHLRSFPPSG